MYIYVDVCVCRAVLKKKKKIFSVRVLSDFLNISL